MAQRDNILSFKPSERRIALDEKARQSVTECRQALERTLPTLIKAMFEQLDDALYELADRSETNKLQTAYFDAMRLVRKHRPNVEQYFLKGVSEDFEQLWIRGPRCLVIEDPLPANTDPDLALIGEEELEESLAVSNLVSKSENRYHRELFALNQRFSQLLGGMEVENHSNPLGPTGICQRFRDGLRGLVIETPIRLVIYKLFDKQVMSSMGGLYEELNSLMNRAGFMTKPAARLKQAAMNRSDHAGQGAGASREAGSRDASPTRGTAQEPEDAPGALHEGELMQVELFRQLQDLINVYRGNAGARSVPNLPVGGSVPVVGTTELLAALSALQQSAFAFYQPTVGTQPDQHDLRGQLAEELRLQDSGEANRSLGKTDQDTLDVVSMLFEFMLDDPALPDAMKALIARLQIPMVKVAIVDKSFFSRKLHPARRLLNTLAQAAVSWTDDGDRSEHSLYGHIETIVTRIISEFVDDPTVFAQLHEEFTQYLERERRGAELAEERTHQVTRGKEQLRVAKDVVGEEIEQRLKASPQVPSVVRELLTEGWLDVLLLTYLRQGPDSETWKAQLTLADRLLWSVQPKRQYEERHELLRDIPELLRGLREGLDGISFDQHKAARLFKELQSCHIASLRGGPTDQHPPSMPAVTAGLPRQRPANPPTPAAVIPIAKSDISSQTPAPDALPLPMVEDKIGPQSAADVADQDQDQYRELAASLSVGTWMELREEDGKQVRIKLSWKSEVADTHVFVNRKGIKVLEITLPGIAMLLRRGAAEILTDVDTPILDRALGAMVRALKQTESGV